MPCAFREEEDEVNRCHGKKYHQATMPIQAKFVALDIVLKDRKLPQFPHQETLDAAAHIGRQQPPCRRRIGTPTTSVTATRAAQAGSGQGRVRPFGLGAILKRRPQNL